MTVDLIAAYETQQANGGRNNVRTMLKKKKIELEEALECTASGRLAAAPPTTAAAPPTSTVVVQQLQDRVG